jgi:signal transduction histidine kinase
MVGDILIVDDNPANLVAMEAALGDLGGRVLRAQSGEEALSLLLERDFALIMLDVKMPSLGGIETAQLIRERKRSRHTPIIFVTAYGRDEQDVLAAYKLGAVDFLFKPIIAEVVRAKAGVFVELQRRTEEISRQAQLLREHQRREHERVLMEERLRFDEEVLRRERDALAEVDRRKDEFIAMLGHELRNPLAAIATGLEVLGRRLSNQPAADASLDRVQTRIVRQMGHLTRLVDDLVDIARIASDKLELRRKRVAFQDIIEQAVAMCRPLAEQRQHTLVVSVPASRVTLDADAVRLTQVVANLVTNAARYTDEGGRIQIDCALRGDAVEVAVSDTGRGIAPELLPRIFDKFVQGNKAGDGGLGLGLGLAIVKRLVEMHDGSVSVSSAGVGQGSEFRVRLPVVTDAALTEAGPEADPARPTAPIEPLAVAVVEDNKDLREGLLELLEMMGHEVEVAHDGETGAELILRRQPDVAFVDIGLPQMDGYAVAARVRAALGPHEVRLVAMTGFGQPSDLHRSRQAGFDDHILKPPNVEVLESILSLAGRGVS